jgi:hypothetical protein
VEENLNQGNTVLALYAAFAGFLLILGASVKLWTDYQDKRRSPRLHFPKLSKRAKRAIKEHTLAAGGR